MFGSIVSGVINGDVIPNGGSPVYGIIVFSGVIVREGILLSGTSVSSGDQLNTAGVGSLLPARSVALTWNVCTVLPVLLIPAANWKTFLSKTAGLEQVNVGKLSTLQLYPAIAESSVPANVRAIEFDAVVVVVSPPFCMFKPMLL